MCVLLLVCVYEWKARVTVQECSFTTVIFRKIIRDRVFHPGSKIVKVTCSDLLTRLCHDTRAESWSSSLFFSVELTHSPCSARCRKRLASIRVHAVSVAKDYDTYSPHRTCADVRSNEPEGVAFASWRNFMRESTPREGTPCTPEKSTVTVMSLSARTSSACTSQIGQRSDAGLWRYAWPYAWDRDWGRGSISCHTSHNS